MAQGSADAAYRHRGGYRDHACQSGEHLESRSINEGIHGSPPALRAFELDCAMVNDGLT
jgi:hypothetical protein